MTWRIRLGLGLALLLGGAARIDSVSRLYPDNADQKTDVRRYYQGMAESVLAGRGWLPTYPTNFIPPPGQAVFILIPKWIAPNVDFRQLRLLQAATSILTLLIGFQIARRLWGDLAGLATAWLLVLYFPLTYYVGTLVPETNYAACLFAFVLATVEAHRRPDAARFALAGILIGLAVVFKPVPSLFGVFLLPWVWRSSKKASRLRNAIVFILAAWLLPGAWILRNAIHYGQIYPVSTNGGTLLALANNAGLDPARPDMMYWDDLYRRGDLFRDPEIEARYAGVVDVDGKPEENLKDRAYAKKTIGYIVSNPLHFARNYVIKLGNFLFHPRPGELTEVARPWPFRELRPVQDALLVLGFVGLAALFFQGRAGGETTPMILLIVYLVLMGALMHLTRDSRMNLPLRALLSLPAGFTISEIIGRIFRKRESTGSEA